MHYEILSAAAIDSGVGYVVEQPVQYVMYDNFFKKMPHKSAVVGVSLVSLLIDITISVITYSIIFKSNLTKPKMQKHIATVLLANLIFVPMYTYVSLRVLGNVPPQKRIVAHTIVLYMLSFCGRVLLSYIIWGAKNK